MSALSTLRLPRALLSDVYEHLALELLELREIDTARQVLRTAEPMAAMKAREPERYAHLESLAGRPFFDAREGYPDGATKERRRAYLAEKLRAEVASVPPSRLLTLLGQALKWQQLHGQLAPGARFDLLHGSAARVVIEPEARVTTAGPSIKFGKKSHAECAAFSPDGQYLISGSVDGFIEVWDFEKGKLRLDLAYQAPEGPTRRPPSPPSP